MRRITGFDLLFVSSPNLVSAYVARCVELGLGCQIAEIARTDLEKVKMAEAATSPYMKREEIENIHPVSDRARQRAEAAGLFPRRVKLAPHIPAWRRSDVAAWQADPNAWAKRA